MSKAPDRGLGCNRSVRPSWALVCGVCRRALLIVAIAVAGHFARAKGHLLFVVFVSLQVFNV